MDATSHPTMSDEWFQSRIAPADAPDDGCLAEEAHALQDYLQHKTTAEEAARAITRAILADGNPHEHLPPVWSLLIDALVEWPMSEIPRVIALLDAIQRLPEPNPTGQDPAASDQPGHDLLWRNLPGFGHLWADEHKRDNWRQHVADQPAADRADLRRRHIRIASIEARLVVASIGDIPIDWGYDCLADAFELRAAVHDFEVPAAAEWIAIAGERMYAGAVRGDESWALERRRDFGKEARCMSIERWSFWGRRLEEMLEEAEVTGDAAREAGRCFRALRADFSRGR